MDESFELDILTVQPSQLYVSAAKLAAVQAWLGTALDLEAPLPVKQLGGRIVLTDGHTRALALHQNGAQVLRVAWDEDALDWAAYETCVGWCLLEGVANVTDLAARVIPAAEYQRLWVERCEREFGNEK